MAKLSISQRKKYSKLYEKLNLIRDFTCLENISCKRCGKADCADPSFYETTCDSPKKGTPIVVPVVSVYCKYCEAFQFNMHPKEDRFPQAEINQFKKFADGTE